MEREEKKREQFIKELLPPVRKNIKVLQHDKNDCAAACLSSVASHYGLFLPLTTIREACGTGCDGTSIKGILDAAKNLGFSANAFKSPEKKIKTLFPLQKPVILHLQKEDGWLHFAVLYEMSQKNGVILDPADGQLHKMELTKLEKEWSGYLVTLTPSDNFKAADNRTNIASRFKKLLIANKRDLLKALWYSMIYILAGLSTSIFIQQIIDNVLPQKEISPLISIGALMVILMFVSLLVGYSRSIFAMRAGIKIDATLITGYLSKLLHLPISFFNSRSSGELNSRIGDAYKVRSFLSARLIVIFISIFSLIISFALLFTFYWKLALLTICFIPLYYAIYRISYSVGKKRNKEMIESSAKFEETTIETLNSIRSIKYFGAQDIFLGKLESKYGDMANKIYRGGKEMSFLACCSDGITRILTLTILVVGGFFVTRGELSVGELVSFYSVASFFTTPLMTLIESNSSITEAQIASKRLFEIMDLEAEENGKEIKIDLSQPRDLSVENVSFSYPGRSELLKNLSFSLKNGTITAIIGDSGTGKSTLVSLIMGNYKPVSGSIKIGGIPIDRIERQRWREYVSIVPQRVDIFNGTILENIAPNDSEPDMESIMSVCRLCAMDSFLSRLPAGILGLVGEQGCNLSGGEKQKIAIARALYRNSKIIIMDEATSCLDKKSREEINALIKSLSIGGITIVLISHDLENIKLADNIIDLNSRTCESQS